MHMPDKNLAMNEFALKGGPHNNQEFCFVSHLYIPLK